MLLGGISLFAYNLWDNHRAQTESNNILEELANKKDKIDNEQKQSEENKKIPSIEIDNYNYIGIITIPKINLKLPVIDSFSYEKLKKAPCLYDGTIYDNNMIIAAHDYLSHFGKLKKLKNNDNIYFEDINGVVYKYSVIETTVLKETDGDKIYEGNWDLTLFTCTLSGDKRVTIRAKLEY